MGLSGTTSAYDSFSPIGRRRSVTIQWKTKSGQKTKTGPQVAPNECK